MCPRGAHFLHNVSAETHPQTRPPYSSPAKKTKPTDVTFTKPFIKIFGCKADALRARTSALRDGPSINEGVAFPAIQSTREESRPRSP